MKCLGKSTGTLSLGLHSRNNRDLQEAVIQNVKQENHYIIIAGEYHKRQNKYRRDCNSNQSKTERDVDSESQIE